MSSDDEQDAGDEPDVSEIDEPSVERTDPFDQLDATVEDPFDELDAAGEPDEDPFEGIDTEADSDADPFEEMAVDSVDGDDLWETLDEDGGPEVGVVAAKPVDGEDGREDHIVDKREYCQRCPNFTDPPEVGCTLDDVDIVAVVNSDEFRVRGCPMITDDGPQFDSTS